MFAELGDHAKAVTAFECGLEINLYDEELWKQKAACLAKLGEEVRARHCFERAGEIEMERATRPEYFP